MRPHLIQPPSRRTRPPSGGICANIYLFAQLEHCTRTATQHVMLTTGGCGVRRPRLSSVSIRPSASLTRSAAKRRNRERCVALMDATKRLYTACLQGSHSKLSMACCFQRKSPAASKSAATRELTLPARRAAPFVRSHSGHWSPQRFPRRSAARGVMKTARNAAALRLSSYAHMQQNIHPSHRVHRINLSHVLKT